MAEKSYLWTTGGAGDGASSYTRADWSIISKILTSVHGEYGISPTLGNGLMGSVPAANTVRIDTGGAVVDGKPYYNDSTVDVTIPSAVGSGNTRLDRIVLRANWTAQTVRITRIPGTDAAAPTAPAVTRTPGSTWDLMLYSVLVDTSGTVSLSWEREESLITGDMIGNYQVAWANVGVGVPAFPHHESGSQDAWGTPGRTQYQNGNVLMFAGSQTATVFGDIVAAFPYGFAGKPLLFLTSQTDKVYVSAYSVDHVGFSAVAYNHDGTPAANAVVNWLAIGAAPW